MLKLVSATVALLFIVLFPSTSAAQSGAGEYIIENDAAEATSSGSWTRSNLPSSYNASSLWAVVGGAVDRFRFTPSLATSGNYEVFAWNSCYSNRATNVRHIVTHSAGSTLIEVDQDCDTGSFGEWFSLGIFGFDAGSSGHLEITDEGIVPPATTYMGADAARWLLRDAVNAPVITPNVTTLTLIEGDIATLAATAADIEDGDLTTAISWQVDTVADTALGANFSFTPPLGDSVVTLSATDSEGNEGSATITVSVLPDPDNMPPQEEYIIDNTDPGATAEGTWNSTSLPNQFGSSSLWATVGGATERFRFTPALEVAGNYEVFAWNSCFGNRATNVGHIVTHSAGSTLIEVDQDCDTGSFGEWFSLGIFNFNAGSAGHLEITDDGIVPPATTYMGADAARWVLRDTVNAPVVTPNDTTLSLTEGDTAILTATAVDFEDGDLTAAISWQVNTAGDTATGADFSFTPPVGDSLVTLSATDSEGNVGSATIAISVLPVPGYVPTQREYIIDNTDPGTSSVGTWNTASLPDQFGDSSLWATAGGAVDSFRFTPILEAAGDYEVFAWNSCFNNRAPNVFHDIATVDGIYTVLVDQDCDTGSHGEWLSLGVFPFAAGSAGYLEITDEYLNPTSTTYIGADAARFVYVDPTPDASPDVFVPDNGVALSVFPSSSKLTKTVQVLNYWNDPYIDWEATSFERWLSATVDFAFPGELTLTADPTGLAPNQLHTAKVFVTSPNVDSLEQITVTLWIGDTDPEEVVEVSANYRSAIADPVRPYVYLTGSGNTVDIYNVYTGTLVDQFTVEYNQQLFSFFGRSTISHDGQFLFINDPNNDSLVRVNLADYSDIAVWDSPAAIVEYARPGGHPVILTDDGYVLDATTGEEIYTTGDTPLIGEADITSSLSGNRFCALDSGRNPYMFECLDLYIGKQSLTLHMDSLGVITEMPPRTGNPIGTAGNGIDIELSNDGNTAYLATGDESLFTVVAVDNNMALRDSFSTANNYVNAIVVGPDDEVIVTAGSLTGPEDIFVYTSFEFLIKSGYVSAGGDPIVDRSLTVSGDGNMSIVLTGRPVTAGNDRLIFFRNY